MPQLRVAIPLLLALLSCPAAVQAQSDDRFEIGVRMVVLTAGGEPTNDQLGAGLHASYRLTQRWRIGLGLDSLSGDFERPYSVGLTSPVELDSTAEYLLVRAWVEREYGRPERKLHWVWRAGLGFTSPDTDDLTGPTTEGGTFDITTDAGWRPCSRSAAGCGERWVSGGASTPACARTGTSPPGRCGIGSRETAGRSRTTRRWAWKPEWPGASEPARRTVHHPQPRALRSATIARIRPWVGGENQASRNSSRVTRVGAPDALDRGRAQVALGEREGPRSLPASSASRARQWASKPSAPGARARARVASASSSV